MRGTARFAHARVRVRRVWHAQRAPSELLAIGVGRVGTFTLSAVGVSAIWRLQTQQSSEKQRRTSPPIVGCERGRGLAA